MNSFASIAAALAAAATNASAGIASHTKRLQSLASPSTSSHSHSKSTDLTNHEFVDNSDSSFKDVTLKNTHHIDTNLKDFSVGWHRMSLPIETTTEKHDVTLKKDDHQKNLSMIKEKRQEGTSRSLDLGTSSSIKSQSVDQLDHDLTKELRMTDQINPVNDLIQNNEILDSTQSTLIFKKSSTSSQQSFQQEFSSLLLNSTLSSKICSALEKTQIQLDILPIEMVDQVSEIGSLLSNPTIGSSNWSSTTVHMPPRPFPANSPPLSSSKPSTELTQTGTVTEPAQFSVKDLMEQISLFNKYNQSRMNDLTFEMINNASNLKITGIIKIHWNLKSALRIEIEETSSTEANNRNFISLKDLNERKRQQNRQGSVDDSHLEKKLNENKKISKRSHTVKSKPNNKKRPPLSSMMMKNEDNNENDTEIAEKDQMFIPSYGTVSSICIDNVTTTQAAIQVLFDKYHISNEPCDFSLYKVYQSGDKKELTDDDLPLVHRLWMGPFNEDKLFIMEKGRELKMSQDMANMACLPQPVLSNLIEKLNQDEMRSEQSMRAKYENYLYFLNERLALTATIQV